MNDLMLKIGFKTVLTGVPLARKYLDEQQLKGGEALSDNQFMESFVSLLKARQADGKTQKPLFAGLYNLGTHSYKKISPDGKKYKKGQNLSLNTIHNYDYAFATFWDYFQKSPYADNTLVIFTADHAHYPGKSFVDAFEGTGYQPLFIDQIPLIIYDPTRKLPNSFDAKYSTSIDFAPSLLHYLQLYNGTNPFMGTSIFTSEKQEGTHHGIAQFGREVYLIDNVRVHTSDFSIKYAKQLALWGKFIKYSQQLEITGKLWQEEADRERPEADKPQ